VVGSKQIDKNHRHILVGLTHVARKSKTTRRETLTTLTRKKGGGEQVKEKKSAVEEATGRTVTHTQKGGKQKTWDALYGHLKCEGKGLESLVLKMVG